MFALINALFRQLLIVIPVALEGKLQPNSSFEVMEMAQLRKCLLYRPKPQNPGEKNWCPDTVLIIQTQGGRWGRPWAVLTSLASLLRDSAPMRDPLSEQRGLPLHRHGIPGCPPTYMWCWAHTCASVHTWFSSHTSALAIRLYQACLETDVHRSCRLVCTVCLSVPYSVQALFPF